MIGQELILEFSDCRRPIAEALCARVFGNGLARRQQRIADFNFEIEIGKGFRIIALKLHGQGQPEAKLSDVGGEAIEINAVEVVANDVELAMVVIAGGGLLGPSVEDASEGVKFVEHPDQIRARPASGIANSDVGELAAECFRLIDSDALWVMMMNELAMPPKIPLECLPAHEGYDGSGRVVGATFVAASYQFLEHLPEHLRIDGDLRTAVAAYAWMATL